MREVLAARRRGDDAGAALALDVYVHRLRAGIAAMAAALGGLDVLVFTGGVGEHAPAIRARAAAGLAFLGVASTPPPTMRVTGDAEITARGAPVRTLVLRAREDLEMARQARDAAGPPSISRPRSYSAPRLRGVPDGRPPLRP